MIGVITKDHETETVSEFFELFKTPWEFYEPGHRYDVLLVAGEVLPKTDAALVVLYSGEKLPFDDDETSEQSSSNIDTFLYWGDIQLPIYGKSITFPNSSNVPFLQDKTQKSYKTIYQS